MDTYLSNDNFGARRGCAGGGVVSIGGTNRTLEGKNMTPLISLCNFHLKDESQKFYAHNLWTVEQIELK